MKSYEKTRHKKSEFLGIISQSEGARTSMAETVGLPSTQAFAAFGGHDACLTPLLSLPAGC